MKKLVSRYATPSITGLFLVSLLSGVMLFFHVGPSGVHGMHEWLSMVLIVPFALHLWKNWWAMKGYFRHAPIAIALVASAAAAAAFLVPAGGAGRQGGPPQFRLAQLVLSHKLADVAPALGQTPEALRARLLAHGFTVSNPDQTLTAIAAASDKSDAELTALLVAGEGQ